MRLVLPLLLTAALAPAAVQAQSVRSLDSRLERVERVLDSSLLDQLQRVDALELEIKQLRGEIESLNYELENQRKRAADLYDDTDSRLTEVEEAQAAGLFGDGEPSGLEELTSGGGLDETALGREPRAVIVPEGGQPVRVATPEEFGDGPIPPQGPLRDTATQAEKTSYTEAYDLLARGQNESAVTSFSNFLLTYPDGPYSDNAWYWQGEAMYADRSFDDALRNFGVVVNSFPTSTKVPDARLKIGFALYEQENYVDARRILTGVQDDYPGRSAAVLARKRLQKMDREGR